jgi:hypothetical protein
VHLPPPHLLRGRLGHHVISEQLDTEGVFDPSHRQAEGSSDTPLDGPIRGRTERFGHGCRDLQHIAHRYEARFG